MPVADEMHKNVDWMVLRALAEQMYASYPHGTYTLIATNGWSIELKFRVPLTAAGQVELRRPRWDRQTDCVMSKAEYEFAPTGPQLGIRRYFVNSK